MPKYPLKNLVLSSLLLLLFGGCSFFNSGYYQRIPETVVDRNNILPLLRGDTNRFLFRTHVDIYRNHLGGLMLIRPVNGKDYRVLFITEVGIKIFDMEFFNSGGFKLHYCMDAMKRKSVLEILKNDIGLLLNSFPENGQIEMKKNKQTGNIVIKSKDKRSVKYYFVEENTRVNKITQKSGWLKKADMTIYRADSHEIDSIRISHSTVKLNIYLSKLHESKSTVSE